MSGSILDPNITVVVTTDPNTLVQSSTVEIVTPAFAHRPDAVAAEPRSPTIKDHYHHPRPQQLPPCGSRIPPCGSRTPPC